MGRAEQRRIFTAALRGEPDAPRILLVHGLGGIGKSALLRQFADDAHDSGHTVLWVDGEQVSASTTAFEEQAAPSRTSERPVLLVDGFEHCQPLETWLREQFLFTVPEEALVVVAGRERPEPQWTLDPGWRDLACPMPLDPLAENEVGTLLEQRGVPKANHSAVHEFAGGHPLALCLAAEAVNETPSFDSSLWTPGPDVVKTLLRQLIDRAPSAAHQYGLRVCGHVRHTTLDLLRTGLDEDAAVAVFDWLADLAYVEPSQDGLLVHELVRDVLDADFAWRDPQRYTELHLRLWRRLGERAQAASGDAVEPAVAELLYVLQYRSAGHEEMFDAAESEAIVERPYTPELRADVLRMTREDQGDEQARLAGYWLDRHPEAFRLYCRVRDNRPISVFAWLCLHPDVDDFTADPVLVPIREHIDRYGLRDNEYVGVARFLVPAPVADRYTTGSALHIARISVENMCRKDGLAAIFLLQPALESLIFNMEIFGYSVLCRIPDMSERSWVVLVRDWREVPVSSALDRVAPPQVEPSEEWRTRAPRLTQDEHDDAVRRALRDWHDDDAVAANPLTGVYGDGAAVRDALSGALDALNTDPSRVKHQRVVRATYLERTTSQEATATHLGIPFSTYRRYLTSGVRQVCEYLWIRHNDRVPQSYRA